MIEDLEAELTGSLTKIGWSLESTCSSVHHVSQGQRTRVSSGRCPYNKKINLRSDRWQFKLLIVLPEIKLLLEGGQRFFSKNATAQGQVLIHRRIWIPY